jgi:hypothetical protein
MILHDVCGFETWSLKPMEEERLKVYEKKLLRR